MNEVEDKGYGSGQTVPALDAIARVAVDEAVPVLHRIRDLEVMRDEITTHIDSLQPANSFRRALKRIGRASRLQKYLPHYERARTHVLVFARRARRGGDCISGAARDAGRERSFVSKNFSREGDEGSEGRSASVFFAASRDTGPLPTSRCPACGYAMDCATGLEQRPTPEPHDLSLCAKCGAMLQFSDILVLKPLRDEVFATLPTPTKRLLERAAALIRKRGRMPDEH
ncbi:MAG TPA: hypothetical protein VNT99_08390 [Methylomirabilota bacterium]|nr:hypothetical protein [Methylomirabilota bacterium]